LEAAQVGAAAAVADVAVGPHKVLGRPLDPEPSEGVSADIVEDTGYRFSGEAVHRD
jgi:hypothetical protein